MVQENWIITDFASPDLAYLVICPGVSNGDLSCVAYARIFNILLYNCMYIVSYYS